MRLARLSLFLLIANFTYAQDDGIGLLCIPEASGAQIDGQEGEGEWDDASSFFINGGEADEVEVRLKHDNFSFFFAFSGELSDNFQFPEVYFDLEHDQSSQWQADDWWFHVSATDCDNSGAPSVYDNCMLEQPDWFAQPNFGLKPQVEFVEIEIPFAALETGSLLSDTIGLGLAVSNTVNTWDMWPEFADYQNPQTWVSFIVCSESVGLEDKHTQEFSVFPNPSNNSFRLDNVAAGTRYSLIDLSGGEILSGVYRGVGEAIDVSMLPEGMYLLRIDNAASRRVVIVR